jgi:hypothetical protein
MTGNDDESTIVNGSPGAAGMKGESDARGTAATVDANSAESAARFYAKSCVVSFFLGLSTVMLISSGCSFFVTVSLVLTAWIVTQVPERGARMARRSE